MTRVWGEWKAIAMQSRRDATRWNEVSGVTVEQARADALAGHAETRERVAAGRKVFEVRYPRADP